MAAGDVELDDVAVFVAVVDAGGFSAAARLLAAPKSSVSRRVARLEHRLGTRLLQRTTRSVTLTEAGRAFHARTAAALAELRDAASAAYDAREVPRGTVRMTGPPDVGAEVLPGLLAAFVRLHPEVRVEVELSADPPDLVGAGFDLALLAGPPPGPGLATAKLQDVAFRLYAAPDHLARCGTPATVAELADQPCVLFRPRDGAVRWRLRGPDGPVEVQVRGPVAGTDMAFVRRAAVAGAGVALLPELVGGHAVRAGRLAPVLPELHAGGLPLHLAYPSSPHVPLKVRALRDFLLREFPH